jgi:RHS repeat-associated protein
MNSELYTYDSVYRITDFARGQLNGTNTAIPLPSSTQDWTLDGLGNWRVNLINGLTQTRSVSSTNQYKSIVGPGATTDADSYDNNGNLILSAGQALAYEWDYRNRLRAVCALTGSATHCTDPGASVLAVYSYDALGRRTRKVVTNSGALNGTTNFYYDGGQNIEERDGTDTETQQYVYGIYVDEPLVLDQAGGARYFYHQNTLYSTFALTDSTGALAEGYQYDAYGAQTVFGPDFTTVLGTASAVGNPYLYTGQRFDPETGLYYYKSRYYSTALGRFISRDAFRDADINLYEYVVDRPTALVDPYGDKAKDCARNKTPKRVVLNSGDQGSDYRNLTYSLRRNETTFKDVANRIAGQLKADCDCSGELILQAHSNPGWFDLRGRRYKQRLNAATGKMVDTNELEGFNDVAVTEGDDPEKYTRLVAENTQKFIEIVKGKACFCTPCKMYLLGCNVGLGDIAEKMHEATKCTIYAPKGYISQTRDPSNPWPLERSITIRREGDYTPYPGAEAKYGVFPPPPEKKKKK